MVPRQCELTYVNHIDLASHGWSHAELHRVLRLSSPVPASLPPPEAIHSRVQFRILGPGQEPLGRLHVEVVPGYSTKELTPIFVMTLTARGAPLSDSTEGILGFIDRGHDSLVKTFDLVTTPEMHKVWGRVHGSKSGN